MTSSRSASRVGRWARAIGGRIADRRRSRRGVRAPYYIVAPPYDETSAGNRVLYELASRLRARGEEAFVAIHEQWQPVWAVPARYDAVCLTPELASRHQRQGRAPICVYPEITHRPADCGLRVLYLLNHVGAMGSGADIAHYDYVVSYSAAIARRSPRSDLTMHLPASDADFWSPDPDPDARRSGAAIYAGKYIDVHRQTLPADIPDAVVIRRHGLGVPTREELRDLFRTSTHLYVFESTALATEAVLCGCPVVYRTNPYFDGHVGEEELSLAGFTTSDDPAALRDAASATERFRERYRAAIAAGEAALDIFVNETQTAAAAATCPAPFPVRSLRSEGQPPGASTNPCNDEVGAIPRHEAADRDTRLAYWLFLGREPESIASLAAKRALSPNELAAVLLDSDEFADRIVGPICAGRDASVASIDREAMATLQDWLAGALPLGEEARASLRPTLGWHTLLMTVLADAQFGRAIVTARSEWRQPRFRAALAARIAQDGAAVARDGSADRA